MTGSAIDRRRIWISAAGIGALLLSFLAAIPAPGGLSLNPLTVLDLSGNPLSTFTRRTKLGTDAATYSFRLKNEQIESHSAQISVTDVSAPGSWLSASPPTVSLSHDQQATIDVSFSTAALPLPTPPAQNYTARVKIHDTNGQTVPQDVYVNVILEVKGPDYDPGPPMNIRY